MLTRVVVLYMTYMLNMPDWCRVIMWIGMVSDIFRILYAIYTAGKKIGKGE